MNDTTLVSPQVSNFVTNLKKRWWLWMLPTVLFAALSTSYAIVRPTTWKATQALLVRDEAAGGINRQGRFGTSDEMKTAQETILQVAKNRTLLADALKQAGQPAERKAKGAWPTEDEIGRFRKSISVTAPNGAEFGRTEVIQLSVTAPTRQRAEVLAKAVCDKLDERLQELRAVKAESVIAELVKAENLAQTELHEATGRLQLLEKKVGSDLGELRSLNDAGSGGGNLRSALTQIKNELRAARARHEVNLKQRDLIAAAQSNPARLIATPNQLLQSQPALRRLKEGLVDAQLHKSELSGELSKQHPKMQAALEAEQQVADQLRRELANAAAGITADLDVSGALVDSLEKQQADVTDRLDRLAELRADYSNLVAEVARLNDLVEQAHRELSDARASEQSAQTASLLTRLEGPQTGNAPLGPRRSAIAGSGLLGGLMTGLGLVFLTTSSGASRGRRRSDVLSGGRRASDHAAPTADDATGAESRAGDQPGQQRGSDAVAAAPPQAVTPAAKPADASFGRRSYDRTPPADANERPTAAPLNLAQSLQALQNQPRQPQA